jgi:hypothetical protein
MTPPPREDDVAEMMKRIKNHLERLNASESIFSKKPQRVATLSIENKIILTDSCLLHHFSDKLTVKNTTGCDKQVRQYLENNSTFDIKKLIELTTQNNDFAKDTSFYRNLYYFNIHLLDFIKSPTSPYAKLDHTAQNAISKNVFDFTGQSIHYIIEYMNKYKVSSTTLTKYVYNLILRRTELKIREVNTSSMGVIGYDDLQKNYEALQKLITDNISLLRKTSNIRSSLKPGSMEESATINDKHSEIDNLNKALIQKIDNMKKANTELTIHYNELNEKFNDIKEIVAASSDVQSSQKKSSTKSYRK